MQRAWGVERAGTALEIKLTDCQAAPSSSFSGASHASDLRHLCWLPQAGHFTFAGMSGRLLKLYGSVSMPVAISRHVRGQRVMIMLMGPLLPLGTISNF